MDEKIETVYLFSFLFPCVTFCDRRNDRHTEQIRLIDYRLTKIANFFRVGYSLIIVESILYVFFVYSPRYVFWYHNARMINFDSERGISVTTTPGRRTHSQLSIKKAEVVDSGNYTCAPSNSLPASIQVFVSNTRGNISLLLLLKAFSCCFYRSLTWGAAF